MDSQVFQKDQDENAWEINDGFKFKRFGNKKLAETTNIRKTISWQSEATNLTNNTSFPVIVQETPIINRNRELRNAKRRSSLELRGKRVSVLNGVAGTPHESIDPAQYYRHIDADQPDAIRMRQLLIWACEKVINSYSYVDSNPEVVLQVEKDQRQVVEKLINKQINTSWFNDASSEQINEKMASLQESLDLLALEESKWVSLVKDVKEKHAKVMDHCSFVELTTVSKNTEAIKDLVDVSNLSKERQARLKEWDSDADISGWTTSIFDRINTSISNIHASVNKNEAYEERYTKNFCRELNDEMVRAYVERERSEMDHIEPIDLLRMLSSK